MKQQQKPLLSLLKIVTSADYNRPDYDCSLAPFLQIYEEFHLVSTNGVWRLECTAVFEETVSQVYPGQNFRVKTWLFSPGAGRAAQVLDTNMFSTKQELEDFFYSSTIWCENSWFNGRQEIKFSETASRIYRKAFEEMISSKALQPENAENIQTVKAAFCIQQGIPSVLVECDLETGFTLALAQSNKTSTEVFVEAGLMSETDDVDFDFLIDKIVKHYENNSI